jgi:2-octaprenyl-6-methoxyphenol hydroxylase
MTPHDCDVLIVGGGLVGSTLAHALLQAGLDVALVETRDPRKLEQESFDERVSALANGSRRILEGLGLWSLLRGQAEPIRLIHVSERGRFGAARIDAREEGVEALGYTVANRALGAALWQVLEATDSDRFQCLAPATLVQLDVDADHARAHVEDGARTHTLRARLVVAADGLRSRVRGVLGIGVAEDNYDQQAIVLNCRMSAEHGGRAFERFTPQGPLAFLPMTDGRMAVVWTLPASLAPSVMALPDADFRAALQQAFGFRLGRILRCGQRAAYALARVRSERVIADRCVLLGNAALSLHPVAGQNFNLALRDVATLSELLKDARREAGQKSDPGAAPLLERYQQWRERDQRSVAGFTHSLIRVFGLEGSMRGAMRGLGLAAFDLAPCAKQWLARRSMGLGGRLPRLSRGLPL